MKTFFDLRIKSLLLALLAATALLACFSTPGALDTRFYYSDGEALRFMESLLPLEVFNYYRGEAIDLLVYIPIYVSLFWFSLRKLYPTRLYHWLALIPLVTDVYETVNILLFLALEKPLLPLMGVATMIKWTSALALSALIFYTLFKRYKKV